MGQVVGELDQEVTGNVITGFALWNEEHTATLLYCPPCFIADQASLYDEYGRHLDELIYDENCDWLGKGGPVTMCHVCGRAVN